MALAIGYPPKSFVHTTGYIMGCEPTQLTLFAATDSVLDACFPGWRLPLPEPRFRTAEWINPFTNERPTFLSWDPGRPPGKSPARLRANSPRSIHDARRRRAVDPILPPENDDDRWLQENTPALLRTFPHFSLCAVSIPPWLKDLLAVLNLPDSPPARIVDCPEGEGEIHSLPEAVIAPLARLDDRELKKTLAAWQKALGIKGKQAKRIEEEAAEGSAWALRRIRALAAKADGGGGHLFLFVRT